MLETSSLYLRPLVESDFEALAAMYADPETMQTLGGTRSRRETREQFERISTSYRERGFGLWATIHKADNCFIGRCGLIAQTVGGVPEIEIGYALRRAYWGRGLATEAAIASRQFGFEKVGCDRLIAIIAPDNFASQRVAQKTGLTYERSTAWRGYDVQVWSLSRSDLPAEKFD